MDRRRSLAALLILATGSVAPPPIREAQWIVPAKRLETLSTLPAACIAPPTAGDSRRAFAIGAVAFRAPFVLGGQAARAGLSCAACHRNGTTNPGFTFPGVSGDPGTADVTSSIFSSHRGDGTFNPKRIPDLVHDAPKVSRDPARPDLERFIHGLIVEEFDGLEPPRAVLDGLSTYVRALGAAGCRPVPARPIAVAGSFAQVNEALALAGDAARRDDVPTARLLISAARADLGRIHERLPVGAFARERAQIEQLDDRLRHFVTDGAVAGELAAAMGNAQALGRRIGARERETLYDPARLAEALAR